MCPEGQTGTPPNCVTPPPPMCPEGQTGTPPNCVKEHMLEEEYAPRTAVYEALPGFLLRLTGPGAAGAGRKRVAKPVWLRLEGGTGSYEPEHSTVGAGYDFDRTQMETGVNIAMGEDAEGWISMRRMTASADVSSPTGDGSIEVEGYGPAFGAVWRGANGYYASGAFALTFLGMDLASDRRGLLNADVEGMGQTLDLEVGHRFAMDGGVVLSPRGRVGYSKVSVDGFRDTVDARVSFPDAERISGRLGVVAQATRAWKDGELSLWGSFDIERIFSGAETTAYVSGERLGSEISENSAHLGLGASWRLGRFSIGGRLSAVGAGSNDREYDGRLDIGMRF